MNTFDSFFLFKFLIFSWFEEVVFKSIYYFWFISIYFFLDILFQSRLLIYFMKVNEIYKWLYYMSTFDLGVPV